MERSQASKESGLRVETKTRLSIVEEEKTGTATTAWLPRRTRRSIRWEVHAGVGRENCERDRSVWVAGEPERGPHLAVADALADAVGLLAVAVAGLHGAEDAGGESQTSRHLPQRQRSTTPAAAAAGRGAERVKTARACRFPARAPGPREQSPNLAAGSRSRLAGGCVRVLALEGSARSRLGPGLLSSLLVREGAWARRGARW